MTLSSTTRLELPISRVLGQSSWRHIPLFTKTNLLLINVRVELRDSRSVQDSGGDCEATPYASSPTDLIG